MAHAKKFIRYCVFVALSLQSSCALAMDTKIPFPQYFPQSPHVPTVPAYSSGKIVLPTINFSPLLDRLSQIDLSGCKPAVLDPIVNNPRIFLAAAALVAASYYCITREVISKERTSAIKAFFMGHAQAFGGSCFDALPREIRGALLLLTGPLGSLGSMIMRYAAYHKKWVGLTIFFALGGRAAGWDGTGYTFAAIAFVYGAFSSRFDAMEEHMDDNQLETNKRLDEVKIEMATNQEKINQHFGDMRDQIDTLSDELNDRLNVLQESFVGLNETIITLGNNTSTDIKNIASDVKDMQGIVNTVSDEIKTNTALLVGLKKDYAGQDQKINNLVKQLEAGLVESENLFNKALDLRIDNLTRVMTKKINNCDDNHNKQHEIVIENLGQLSDAVKAISDCQQDFQGKLDNNEISMKDEIQKLGELVKIGESSINESILSLWTRLSHLEGKCADIENEQKVQGGLTQDILLILNNKSKNKTERSNLILERLEKAEAERKLFEEKFLTKSKKQSQAIKELKKGQKVIIEDISKKIDEVTILGDQRLDRIENGIFNLAGQNQGDRIENVDYSKPFNKKKKNQIEYCKQHSSHNNSSTLNQIQNLLENNF